MMAEITVQIVLSALQTTGLLVGIIYYIMTLNNTRKNQQMQLETRQAQLFMQIYHKFNDPEVINRVIEIFQWEWDSFDEFWGKYSSTVNPDAYRKWNLHAGFFEGIGVLVKRGLIDIELVDDLMSGSTIMYWEKFGPVIVDGRTRFNMPQLWEYAEYLYYEIKNVFDEQHPESKDKPIKMG